MKPRDIFLCVFTMFLWGAQVTAVKIAGKELPPFLMLSCRFAIISIFMLPFAKRISLKNASIFALVATFSTILHFSLLYIGISLVPAATSAVVYQLTPIFTVILAAIFLNDALSVSGMIGIVMSFFGVALLFGGFNANSNAIGVILVALAALSFATGTLLIKKMGPFNPLSLNAWSAIFATPVMFLVSFNLENWSLNSILNASMSAQIALLYAAVSGGLIGFAIWYYLLNKYTISRLVPYTLLVPIFAVAVSQLFLKEQLSLIFFIAAALVVVGVAITQLDLIPRIGNQPERS